MKTNVFNKFCFSSHSPTQMWAEFVFYKIKHEINHDQNFTLTLNKIIKPNLNQINILLTLTE